MVETVVDGFNVFRIMATDGFRLQYDTENILYPFQELIQSPNRNGFRKINYYLKTSDGYYSHRNLLSCILHSNHHYGMVSFDIKSPMVDASFAKISDGLLKHDIQTTSSAGMG